MNKDPYLKIFDELALIIFKVRGKVYLGKLPFSILYLGVEKEFQAKVKKDRITKVSMFTTSIKIEAHLAAFLRSCDI